MKVPFPISTDDPNWYTRPPDLPERISAGGVVVRLEKKDLLVALVKEGDLKGYVLPKGKMEKGETLVEAARREIHEEAGITQLELIIKLGVCQRLNYDRDQWLKAHYFLFTTNQKQGQPTDTSKSYVLEWFNLLKLPHLFWPDQRALIESNRSQILEKTSR